MTDESDAKPAAQVELDAQVKPGAQVKPAAKHKKSNALLNVMIAISAIAMIGALGLIAYPTFSDWWNRMHQSYAVAGYVEQTKDMSGAERKAMLKAAHEYNERLAANGDRWHMTDAQKREYDETLDVTGTGIMGYVTIPRIKVKLPVYHGTSDGVLQIAAGHLAGTSLPVGGATTHAVVSGQHRPAVRPVADRLGRAAKRRHVRIPRARRNLHVPSGPDLSGAAERNQQAEY